MDENIKNPLPYAATLPGEILKAELQERGIRQKDFAASIGLKPSHLSELIKGKRPLTASLAIRLEHSLGIDAELWMRLQSGYELTLARIRQREQEQEAQSAPRIPSAGRTASRRYSVQP